MTNAQSSALLIPLRLLSAVLLAGIALVIPLSATNVAVQYREGLTHGFLVLSTLDGKPIAEGDLLELVHGNQVSNHLIFRFKDGSLQDETTVFSQRKTFSLVSYHLIQKGPAFEHPAEVSIAVSSGQVSVRYSNDKGEEKVENERMKLPPDLANGMVLTLLKNIKPGDPVPPLSILVATPKPRIVKLNISFSAREPFSLVGIKQEALHYVIKVEIGGVAGLLAPLLGKQPPDSHVWIMGGEAPTFVKAEVLSYVGGPMWREELTCPEWPQAAESRGENDAKP